MCSGIWGPASGSGITSTCSTGVILQLELDVVISRAVSEMVILCFGIYLQGLLGSQSSTQTSSAEILSEPSTVGPEPRLRNSHHRIASQKITFPESPAQTMTSLGNVVDGDCEANENVVLYVIRGI